MPTIKVKDKGVWKSIGSAGGGLGAQPNWNQNDPTKEDYIKNRTHYVKDPGEVTVVSGIAGYYPQCDFSTHIELEEGRLYTVTVNGVEYELTTQYENNIGIPYLGNPSYLGAPDNGSNAPFLIAFDTFFAPYGLYNISISTLIDDVLTTLIDETINFYWEWYFDGILEVGHEYKVIFDGIEYNFTATENSDGSAIIIGDMTQDPFEIWYTYDSLILYSLIRGVHTVSMMDMTGESEIIEYQNIGNFLPSYESVPLYKIKDGQTYLVQFGDNIYSCVAAKYDEDDLIYLGNPVYGYIWDGLFEPDIQSTGEPFIYVYSDEYESGYMASDSGSIDNFSITTIESEIHTLDPKFLPEGMGYIETIKDDIIPQTTLEINSDLYVQLNTVYTFTAGKTYSVTFNGEQYECVAWYGEYDDCICIGNGDIYGGAGMGGDEPFSCDSYTDGSCYLNVKTPGEYIIKIQGAVKKAHKMDKDCLPRDVAFLHDIPWVPSQIVNSINGKSGHLTITEGVGKAGIGENAEVFNGINSRNAFGSHSHAEGDESYSFGEASHAENHSIASGAFSHAEGYAANVYGFSFFGDGNSETYTVTDDGYLPSIDSVIWYNNIAARVIAVDYENRTFTVNNALLSPSVQDPIRVYSNIISLGALGDCSHSEGENTSAWSKCSHAEGDSSRSTGIASHAEGRSSNAAGDYSHAEGYSSTADNEASHAEGYGSYAKGYAAHAENQSWAIGNYSHSEGVNYPDARPRRFSYSVVDENDLTVFQVEPNSGVENYIEIGYYADFGWIDSRRKVIDFDKDSRIFTIEYPLDEYDYADTVNHYVTFHSGGIAFGDYSHSEGISSIAASVGQHVQGRYNLVDANDRYAHIVGNGSGFTNTERSNAHTLDWEGNAWFQGDVYVGGTSQDDADRLVKLSEIGNIGGGGSSVQPDWNQSDETAPNYVQNKTHYSIPIENPEVVTLTYNQGDYIPSENRVDLELKTFGNVTLIKLSDNVPKYKKYFLNQELTATSGEQSQSIILNQNILDTASVEAREIEGYEYGNGYILYMCMVWVVLEELNINGHILSEGIWVFTNSEMYISSISYAINEEIVQLDEKYIPDTIARYASVASIREQVEYLDEHMIDARDFSDNMSYVYTPQTSSDYNVNDVDGYGYIANRTHYDTRIVDVFSHLAGSTNNFKEEFEKYKISSNTYMRHVSNLTPDKNLVIGGSVSQTGSPHTYTIEASDITDLVCEGENEIAYSIKSSIYVILSDSATIEGVTYEKGIYFGWSMSRVHHTYVSATLTHTSYIGSGVYRLLYTGTEGEIKQLDEKYIPSTIARTSQLDFFTYGTEDLIAGESELATGKLYFVYE